MGMDMSIPMYKIGQNKKLINNSAVLSLSRCITSEKNSVFVIEFQLSGIFRCIFFSEALFNLGLLPGMPDRV